MWDEKPAAELARRFASACADLRRESSLGRAIQAFATEFGALCGAAAVWVFVDGAWGQHGAAGDEGPPLLHSFEERKVAEHAPCEVPSARGRVAGHLLWEDGEPVIFVAVGWDAPATLRPSLELAAQLLSGWRGEQRANAFSEKQARELALLRAEIAPFREERVEHERLTTLGTLTASIGHEIANPLASILLNHTTLRKRLDNAELSSDLRADADRILGENEDALERVRLILNELRTYGRRSDDRLLPVDLNDVAKAALRLAQGMLRHTQVELALGTVPPVIGSAPRLGQVVLNLLVNAAHAMEGRPDGRVVLRTTCDDREVRLEVNDDGIGIDARNLPRIFDTYFTTKPPGQGTGLGLAITQDIVQEHGGRVDVSSIVGRGSRFAISFPRALAGATTRAVPFARGTQPPEAARRHILIVDDDQVLLKALSRGLEEHYIVSIAHSRAEAHAAAASILFDVLLCDVHLRGESGLEVGAELMKLQRHDRIVYMSGGVLLADARKVIERVGDRFLAKPFELSALIELINRV